LRAQAIPTFFALIGLVGYVAVTQERSNATATCRCKTRKGEKTSADKDS